MVRVFGLKVTPAFVATVLYIIASLILFIIVCIYGWKRLLEQEQKSDDIRNVNKKHTCKRYLRWMKLVWRMKSIYFSALVHIYDIATDVGIIVDWGEQAWKEKNGGPKEDARGVNMMGLFITSLVAFFLYRFISAGFVFEFTGKVKRACIQFFDLEIYNAIYITHKLGRDEAGNLQRWLQKFEAIFESAPQALLQLVYIVKTADYSVLIMSSIVLSFFSVAARFTSDDKIFFNTNAEGLGLKWNKRKCKKSEILAEKNDNDDFSVDRVLSNSQLASNEVLVGEEEENDDTKLLDNKIDKEEIDIDDEWEILWSKWKMWNHIGFNRAYLFRYSFRMCDVFSRLMILALIWCTLTGTTALCILTFEILTFVSYAASIGKYNFFQFLVATYFSEDNRNQTVSYCFFRRMESLLYLIGVSIVVLFHDKYNVDTITQCYKQEQFGGTVEECIRITNYDRSQCDCNLAAEVVSTKILLIAAWAFGNLSGSVFFGAFHSMRQKFGTNERNIVNVMEKRDWEAFSEMLQFGYRMNRFDKKSNRSALSTFLDRVPSDKFDSDEIDRMIQLGADINDTSVRPENENDELEEDKIGDNVLIRYIKVTKCDIIDKEFETVVKKWTTDGVKGGDYSQKLKRIAVDINAKNKDGYTAFKVYWEKIQYKRREKQRILKQIEYKIQCYQIENEISDEKEINVYDLTDGLNEVTEQWFTNFYTNILKWKKLGADMSTLSEDRISTLLAYVQDMDIDNIDMDIVKLLCPIINEQKDEQKYETDDVKIDIINDSEDDNFVTQEIKMKAFSTWITKYNKNKILFDVNHIQIWHDLGCTNNIEEMNLLSLYLQRCPIDKQNTNDIKLLKNCGCSLENDGMEQYLSSLPLPMTNVIDKGFGLKSKIERFDAAFGRFYIQKNIGEYFNDKGDGKFLLWCLNRWRGGTRERAISYAEKYFAETNYDRTPAYYMWEWASDAYEAVGSSTKMTQLIDECWDNDQSYGGKPAPPINLNMLKFFQDEYKLEPERLDMPVYDIDSYVTRLQKIIETQDNLTVEMVKQLMEMGYLIGYKDADTQKILYKATLNKRLPFDVFEFLLNEVLNYDSGDDEKKEKVIELDYQIFNQWIQRNDNIEFEQIETLINKYGFSPYKSSPTEYGCSVHFIWKNLNLKLEVMYEYWKAYGIEKYGKFEHLYVGFLYEIMEHKNLTDTKQFDYLETIFKDFIEKEHRYTGNHILHFYCRNTNINMKVLRHIVTKHESLLNKTNKKDHHALHLLCENNNLKIEYLRYFVEELQVPMDIKTHAGWQPFKALHYLVDNEAIRWSSNDIKIMIHNLNIDFANNRRAGEFVLYRLSHQNNFSTQALIELYDYYKNEVDLNSLKSRKQLYWSKASGGTTILANILSRTNIITCKQIIKLVTPKYKGGIGLDITAKDMENKSILHYASNTKSLTAENLKLIGDLLKEELEKKQKEPFVIDAPDRTGATPFQYWISSIDSDIGSHMEIVETWEALGADITQSENKSAYNMLHNLLSGNTWNIQLSYLRKLCFDDENPWISQEKKTKNKIDDDDEKYVVKKPVNQYQIPLHAKPIPDNMTLGRLYAQTTVSDKEQININILKFFMSKRPIIRFDLDSQTSVLWKYMESENINIKVLKYLIEIIKYKIQPQPSDNIAIRYMQYQKKRSCIDWNILDYFYNELKVDFKQKQNDYMTILHEYARNAKKFNCQEFEQLIEKYELNDILVEKGSTDPTAASLFYEHRRAEIRPDIIKCFKKHYEIDEPISNLTPIQHYCDLSDSHYINPKILESFINDGGARLNYFVGRKGNNNSVSQIIANSDSKIKYTKLLSLEMVMNKFDIQLTNPNKRKQDIWYMFIQRYHSGHQTYNTFFKMFLKLIQIYISTKHEPIHLFHNNKVDENKKIKYKIYTVNDIDYSAQLKLKKNKTKLKEALKFLNRIVFVTDDRDSAFRKCKPIDPRSWIDWEQIQIPQKWLIPIAWNDFISQIKDFELKYDNFMKSQKIAECNYFIDKKLIENVISLHDDNNKTTMINNVSLSDSQNILIKYLKRNHSTQINSSDIDYMKQIGIDFKYGYSSSQDGLRVYVLNEPNGILNKQILEALIRGGCPINWDYEENLDDNDDDEKSNENVKGEVIKTSYTTLHYYAMSEDAHLDGFRKLIECGADIKIESAQNFTAVYYLLKHSNKINTEFIKYVAKDCKYNFNTPLSTTSTDERNSDTILFNMYLRENKNITIECVESLINIADCDPNSRDDINDTSSIKSYLKNENLEKFNINIIKKLVELGADINEQDNEGIYPIQHLLQIQYTPLSKLIQYIKNFIQFGAKLEHILCDDNTVIQDYKLYTLIDMKQGYEHYDNSWCTIDVWIWEYNNKKNKVQSAVALDETGANTKLYINIKRSNLIDINKKLLLQKYPMLKNVKNIMSLEKKNENVFSDNEDDDSDYNDDDDNKIEEEHEEKEEKEEEEEEEYVNNNNNDNQNNSSNNNITMEMANLTKT